MEIKTRKLAEIKFEVLERDACYIVVKERRRLGRKKNGKRKRISYYEYTFTNIEQVRVGDRIEVHSKLPLKIGGPAAVISINNVHILYVYKPGTLKIAVKGKPLSKIKIPVTLPTLPANVASNVAAGFRPTSPPEGGRYKGRLLGPLQPQLAVPNSEVLTPLDRWFVALDTVIDSGCNYLSASPLAPWNDYDVGTPFVAAGVASVAAGFSPPSRPEGRRYNLSKVNPLYRKAMAAWFWRAARAGVCIHWYVFDHVSLTHSFMWDKHPLNARNNVHGWIGDGPCGCGYNKGPGQNVKHKLYAVHDKGCQPEWTGDLIATIFRNLASLIPESLRSQSRGTTGVLSRIADGPYRPPRRTQRALARMTNIFAGSKPRESTGAQPQSTDSQRQQMSLPAGASDMGAQALCGGGDRDREPDLRLVAAARPGAG